MFGICTSPMFTFLDFLSKVVSSIALHGVKKMYTVKPDSHSDSRCTGTVLVYTNSWTLDLSGDLLIE